MTAKPLLHPVPDILLEQDIAVLGQKGSGKSYATKGLVERLLDMGRRTIIIDPLNHWYGLKAKADGTPGYPIIVIGGPNADIALDPKGGERLGEVLAGSERSFIVDVSDLLRSQLIAFTTDFLLSLYRHNREALWLVAEEADVFAPQNPSMDGTRAMHDAVDQIARRGRQRGFRLWSLTQRPARISKDVLTQASTLLVMRIRSPQDRSAAEDWIRGHAEKGAATDVINALASLEVGQGYVYAPDLDLLSKVRFPAIKTLDTSGTPQAGQARVEIRALAPVDVEALRRLLEPAKAATPQPPAKPGKAPSASPGLDLDAIRREARMAGHAAGYLQGHTAGFATGIAMAHKASILAINAQKEPTPAPVNHDLIANEPMFVSKAVTDDRPATVRSGPRLEGVTTPIAAGLAPAALKLLDAICRYADVGLTWDQACIVAGLVPGNGYVYGGRKHLREGGYVEERDGKVYPVDPVRPVEHLTRTQFKALWGSRKEPAPRMFDALCNAGGEWVDLKDLAADLNLKAGNGFWYGGLSQLRKAGLIEQEQTRARVIELIGSAAR